MKGVIMVHLVIFINLFFIPVLPLYVMHRKNKKPLVLNLDLLFQYCIIAACNIPLTKVFTFLSKKLGRVFISIDSGYYTLAALFSAVLIYALYTYQGSELKKKHYAYYKTYSKKKYWTEKVAQRGTKRILGELAPAYLLVFASCFMMLIFEPLLLYATNMNDFWFDFRIMIWPVLGVFACFLLVGLLIVSVIYFVNLFFSGKIILYKLLTLVGYIAFFLLYLQGNWLAGNLPPLTGEPIIWENYGKFEDFILKIAVIILGIAAVISIWKYKLGRTIRYSAVGAGIICIMLAVSLIPTVVGNKALKSKDTFVPTLENYNTVSSNRNFLIFLVDTLDSNVFYDVMTRDEDFDGLLNDFTYYPDTVGAYTLTRDSIPTILTGSVNHNEIGFLDYCNSAYNQSPLFEKLAQNGYGINLYSDSVTWGGKRNYDIENSASIYDAKVDFKGFMYQELKYIRYKYLPYEFKQWSQIETLDFDACKIIDSEQIGYYSWGNVANYSRIQENNVLEKRDENYFQFIHCEGAHAPYDMGKSLSGMDGGTYEQKVTASLTMIKTYLQRLKNNDAYNNSVIVIMADHGRYEESHLVELEEPYVTLDNLNPILFIKGINENHEMLEFDNPVSYFDLQDAFCDLIDGKQSTELFTELQQDRTRTALWYLWTKEYHMVEYETTGKAWEIEKFTPTGNVYDLKE